MKNSPWAWIPSLYFAQGLPYVIVTTLTVIMFKRFGISNTDIAYYTSWLSFPWVIKPLWSPLVDILRTKRWWIIVMQLLIGGGLASVAMILPGPDAFRYSLALMWLLAFSSATHDIAADGFYLLALKEKQQAYFVGIRNTFFRLAIIAGQGGVVMIAGKLEKSLSGSLPAETAIPMAWSIVFYAMAAIFLLLFIYHNIFLPQPADNREDKNQKVSVKSVATDFCNTFSDFFRKKNIVTALCFILLYRFAEAQLVKIASPFMLDPLSQGGLGLETEQVGFIYGTVGVIALTLGGITGGIALSCGGLRKWLYWMTAAMNLPNLVYLYMAIVQPENIFLVTSCVTIEQFGYGFGFTSLTFFMMLFSTGKHQTAQYALCTGFMALGMMLPGMISGWIQELLGYKLFFGWVMLCTLPSFIATGFLRLPEDINAPGRNNQS